MSTDAPLPTHLDHSWGERFQAMTNEHLIHIYFQKKLFPKNTVRVPLAFHDARGPFHCGVRQPPGLRACGPFSASGLWAAFHLLQHKAFFGPPPFGNVSGRIFFSWLPYSAFGAGTHERGHPVCAGRSAAGIRQMGADGAKRQL